MNRQEQAEQIALLKWASLVFIGDKTLADWLIHVPNGGARSKVEAAILKAMGVKPGVPDLLLPIRNSDYSAGWWELKSGSGRLSDEQIERHAMLVDAGNYVRTYWHWSEAANDILRYLQKSTMTVIVRARL